MAIQFTRQKELLKEMRELDLMVINRVDVAAQLMAIQVQPMLIERIKASQNNDPQLRQFREQVEVNLTPVADSTLVIRFVCQKVKFDKKC